MTKLQRRVRRAAKRLLSKRLYRERHDGKRAQVWSVRVGPPPPAPRAGTWSGRHGQGGDISENHKTRRLPYEAGRIAARLARQSKRGGVA